MALVAYDNSDSSDLDDEENENSPDVVMEVAVPSMSKPAQIAVEEPSLSLDTGPKLFNLLPQPSNTKPVVIEEDDEFLHKKEIVTNVKPKAKITVPSLSDFKDVADRTNVRPKAANGKKSGLLSMLPQPKNAVTITTTKSLIPHALTKKPHAATAKKLPVPLKKTQAETKVAVNHYSDESDNDEEVANDFFSINKPIDLPHEATPLEIVPTKRAIQTNLGDQKERTIQSYFKQDMVEEDMRLQPEYEESSSNATTSSSDHNGYGVRESSSTAMLDDEAILKLCGTRGKRKREDIQILEVNQQEVLADAREWLRKGLLEDTSTRASASRRRGGEPTSQQRRKHQITYLAHQAKANESELQNQWANNRMSRRQTQSKYGF